MASLADFTGGFQEGYEFTQKARARRELNRALKDERSKRARERRTALEAEETAFAKEGDVSYEQMLARQQQAVEEGAMPRTWGQKAVDFFGKVGARALGKEYTSPFAVGQYSPALSKYEFQQMRSRTPGGRTAGVTPGQAPFNPDYQGPLNAQQGGSPLPDYLQQFRDGGYAIPRANGGAVRHMVKKYANGGYAIPSANTRSTSRMAMPMADGGYNVPQPPGAVAPPARTGGTALPGLANGGRSLAANQSQQGLVTGVTRSGNTFADGGRYTSALHRYPMPMQDGGSVDEDEDEITTAEAFTAGRESVGLSRLFPETAAVWEEYGAEGAQGQLGVTQPGLSARERGEALAEDVIKAGTGVYELGEAALEDVGVLPALRFLGGLTGIGGDEEAVAPTAAPADTGAQPAATTPPDTQTPAKQEEAAIAQELQQSAAAPGGPQIVDVSSEAMPTTQYMDMPTHTVDEWRQELADAQSLARRLAIVQGRDPDKAAVEAIKAVQANQIIGFTGYMEQARSLLLANDAHGAARAVHMAYQNFPNGSNVKIGIQRGKDGRPVLIGMGTDEKTGEPVADGKAMVLNPQSIDKMVENAQTPGAWANWTMDWRKLEEEHRISEEIDKPLAQARVRALEASATYDELRGLAALKGGGLTESEKRAASKVFDSAFNETYSDLFEDFSDSAKRQLTSTMAQLFTLTAVEPEKILVDVLAAARKGPEEGAKILKDVYGVDVNIPSAK